MAPGDPLPPPTGPAGTPPETSVAVTRSRLSPTALLLILVLGAGTVITYGMRSVQANEARDNPTFQIESDVPLRAPGRPAATQAAGHSFTWGGSGIGATGTVSTSGDYVLETDDGLERRFIAGTSYARRHPMVEWTATDGDSILYVGRLGFRSTISVDDILTDHVRSISTIDVVPAADGTKRVSALISVAGPQAEANLISAWLVTVGLPNTQPLQATDGTISVDLTIAPDGVTVDAMNVDNGIHTSTYELLEVYAYPPAIAVPDEVAGA